MRRDVSPGVAEVTALTSALMGGESVYTTGLVLQELLQGFRGSRDSSRLIERFRSLPSVVPNRTDHIQAALIHNSCRRRGVQVGTIDALLAQLCIRHDLTMLTTDQDFERLAKYHPLSLWASP